MGTSSQICSDLLALFGKPVLPALRGTRAWFTFPISSKLGPHGLRTEFLLKENGILIYES